MTTKMPNRSRRNGEDENDTLKIHISRVPTKFDEAIVLRILTEQLLDTKEKWSDSSKTRPIQVELIYPREEGEDETTDRKSSEGGKERNSTSEGRPADYKESRKGDQAKEHRGFGFVTFQSKEIHDKALSLSTIRGGRKPCSKKQYTMHLRPYTTSPDETNVCYLWATRRCPYGNECKFLHSGPGACIVVAREVDDATKTNRKGKCFAFKKGKCDKGEECPFSHDFEPSLPQTNSKETDSKDVPKSEKDCINWKTKGKCRKGDKCPYRHDSEILKKLEAKKKRKRPGSDEGTTSQNKKQKQPLCVRVFGMAYDTTEDDIRHFFEHCGMIHEVTFPLFEDSGRSKGYCGIVFASPKAVEKAIELNGEELMGRWLSVQAGKMYLRDWEANHALAREQAADE